MQRLFMLSALIVSLAGCGEAKYTFQGKVEFSDGTPVPLARVVFEHGDDARSGVAYADESGFFKDVMFDKPGDGIPAGDYRITVNPPELIGLTEEQRKLSPGPGWGIPQEYRVKSETPFTLTVPMDKEELTLTLERAEGAGQPDVDIEELKAIEEEAESSEEE